LLATSSSLSAPAAAAAVPAFGSEEAMTGILSVQRQQLRNRIEQLEREAAAHRRWALHRQHAAHSPRALELRDDVLARRQHEATQAELQSVRADNVELYAKLRYMRSGASDSSVSVTAGGGAESK
jgi:hypothetical protein